MKSRLMLLLLLVSGCTVGPSLGPKEDAYGFPYSSRSLLSSRENHEFPGLDRKIIRNIEFCMKDGSCSKVFPSDDQIIITTRFVSQNYEAGDKQRVYLYQSYVGDTDGDGIVTENDRSNIYAYKPLESDLVVLKSVDRLHDIKDDVGSKSFFMLYDSDGVRYITRYSMDDLSELGTHVKEP